jgi:hypothetical protein
MRSKLTAEAGAIVADAERLNSRAMKLVARAIETLPIRRTPLEQEIVTIAGRRERWRKEIAAIIGTELDRKE